MNIISMENISKSYGEKTLFQNMNFGVEDQDRIGVVGINGTGKSTLLKLLAGNVEPDTGKIYKNSQMTLHYLAQNAEFEPEWTILEQIYHGDHPLMRLIKAYELATQLLQEQPDNSTVQKEIHRLSDQMDIQGGWNIESQAKAILNQLGIQDVSQKMGTLSGGQRKRVFLAEALIQPSDLLILDEPTNHIDYDTIEWLEDYLKQRKGALLMVTHDRYFLNRVTTRILEIDKSSVYTYDGNYEYFVEIKGQREIEDARLIEKRKSYYLKELDWIRQGAQARSTKQKARIQRFDALEAGLPGQSGDKLEINVAYSRLGKKIIEIKQLSKRYDEKVLFNQYDYIFKKNERIGIVGPNGTGKSTLLNIIAGITPPDAGEVEIGETVKIAYYRQNNEGMPLEARVIDYIKETAEWVETGDGFKITASQMLERFLFDGNLQYSLIRTLSGGEKRRLYLAKILMEAPNVLLLDEPTNDLDIQTLSILEEYIDHFSGVLVTVSHDRYFLEKTSDQIIGLLGQGKVQLFTDLNQYRQFISEPIQTKPVEVVKPKEDKATPKLKLSYKEQKEFETIEADIQLLEAELSQVTQEMTACLTDYVRLQQLTEKQQQLENTIIEKMERFDQLSDLVEQIEASKRG